VPNWAAVPKADDLDGLVGSASDGYVVLEAALPLPAVVPLLAMTRRQKNLKMRLLFNGYPVDRCNTHPGGRHMEDARLMFVYKPHRSSRTELLDEVGAWQAAGELGAVLAERLTVASGILFPASADIAHLRTTGRCDVQPAHTDAWEPWLQPANIPLASLIVALEDNTRVTVFPGSHRVFRWCKDNKVPRGAVGPPVVITLSKGSALLLRQDLFHNGMDAAMEVGQGGESHPVQNDRLFMYLYQGQMQVKNRTCVVEWVDREL